MVPAGTTVEYALIGRTGIRTIKAQSKARKTKPVHFTTRACKMKDDSVIYPGGMVGIDATGYAVPASADDARVIKGIAAENAKNIWDNTNGGDGGMSVVVQGSK